VVLKRPTPLEKIRPARHHHITERQKLIFVVVAIYAHGASLLGGSAKINTPVDRSSYLAHAINMLLRLHTSARNRIDAPQEDNTTQPSDNADASNTAERIDHLPATIEQLTEHPKAMEEDTLLTDTPIEAPWRIVISSERRPQDLTATSPETVDYGDRILSTRHALRAASPTPAKTLRKTTPLWWPKTPSCPHRTAGNCLAQILTPKAPLFPAEQPPHPNAPAPRHKSLSRHVSPWTIYLTDPHPPNPR
jgi:hypothetical protein